MTVKRTTSTESGARGRHSSTPPRRDPRVEPDDDAESAGSRVEVVHIERTGDPVAAAAHGLRRDLAKLQEQAAAVERTLDEQRRERTEAFERLERATQHGLEQQERASKADADAARFKRLYELTAEELTKVQGQRDDFERAVEGSKSIAGDLARLQGELSKLREERDEATRSAETHAADLGELRKRQFQEALKLGDKEREIAKLRNQVKDTSDELAKTTAELASIRAELERTRAEADAARDELARTTTKAAEERAAERTQITAAIGRLRADMAKALEHVSGLASEAVALETGETSNEAAGITRDEVLAWLADPQRVHDAVSVLRTNPEWTTGAPPASLVKSLFALDYDAASPVMDLARAWERQPLCEALIAAVRGEDDVRVREQGAWLLKHLASSASWKAVAELARNDDEPAAVRRWLLEALDRLAAGRAMGWADLGETVAALARHEDASIRDGAIGILTSLAHSEEKTRLLVEVLKEDDDELVLMSAMHALASTDDAELPPEVIERLEAHESRRVQSILSELAPRLRASS